MLPTVALTGNYMISNPNLFNGFEKEFKGVFNVGVLVRIPLLHWGENVYKYRAAKSESLIARLEIEDAKEKIELQVNQATFKVDEARKRLGMTAKNLEKADENLRNAQVGFGEGVLTTDNVLEAQTAWLKAQSEHIDAEIDTKLCEVYLSKKRQRKRPDHRIGSHYHRHRDSRPYRIFPSRTENRDHTGTSRSYPNTHIR